jgi:hypothetical protein
MTETARKQRNAERLAELYPTFRNRVVAVIADLEAQGLRPRIQDAYRSPEDQLVAFNAGHSKLKFGFHNVTGKNGQKESLAVDMLDDNNPTSMKSSYLLQLAAAAEKQGLITGIRWGVDTPTMVAAIDTAIATQNWKAPVKIGWDPTHIEPKGLTVAQAKAGTRPQ